jgi:hypothetical protein
MRTDHAGNGGREQLLPLIVDDRSRYMLLEVIKTKDESFECFKKVKARAEAESGQRLLGF